MLHAAPPPGNDKYPLEPDSPSSLTYITRAVTLVKEDRGCPLCDGERVCVGFISGGSCRLRHPSVGPYRNATRERQHPSGSCSVCVQHLVFAVASACPELTQPPSARLRRGAPV